MWPRGGDIDAELFESSNGANDFQRHVGNPKAIAVNASPKIKI
jgi:hypothetical protein